MKRRTPILLVLLVLSMALLVAACSPASPVPSVHPNESAGASNVTTRTSDGGQVTVVVDWAGLLAGGTFEVQIDTHSVDLDGLDLSDAVLRNDRGDTMTPQPWAAPTGGHHREGALTFEGDVAQFFADATWIELILPGVGDVPERTLRWEIRS